MEISIVDEVVEQLQGMPTHLQQQVLEFTRSLTEPKVKGVPGQTLLQFSGSISAPDLYLMNEYIQQDCAQVDLNEW